MINSSSSSTSSTSSSSSSSSTSSNVNPPPPTSAGSTLTTAIPSTLSSSSSTSSKSSVDLETKLKDRITKFNKIFEQVEETRNLIKKIGIVSVDNPEWDILVIQRKQLVMDIDNVEQKEYPSEVNHFSYGQIVAQHLDVKRILTLYMQVKSMTTSAMQEMERLRPMMKLHGMVVTDMNLLI